MNSEDISAKFVDIHISAKFVDTYISAKIVDIYISAKIVDIFIYIFPAATPHPPNALFPTL